MTNPVQHQLDAFNDRDLGAFMDAFAPDTRVEDGAGNEHVNSAPNRTMHPSRLALLITIFAALWFTPLAEAQPQDSSFTITDVMIPVSDTVDLHGRLYRPDGTEEKRPTIFMLTPYSVDFKHGEGTYFARRGYVYLNVDVRGRGASGGTFWPFSAQDGRDGAEVAEWIRRQPWSNGQVAMRGTSYQGLVQWQVLSENATALQTAVPGAAPYPGWHEPHQFGIPRAGVAWLASLQGRAQHWNLMFDSDYHRRKSRELHRSGQPHSQLDEIAGLSGQMKKEFNRRMQHPTFDDYWKARTPDSTDYRRFNQPILSVTGYFDWANMETLRYYREHQKHGPETAAQNHYVLLGPWDHNGTKSPKQELGGLTFADTAAIDMFGLHRRWFDWVLKEGPRPEMLEDQIVYYVMGAGDWRAAPSLKAVSDTSYALYLRSDAKNPDDPFDSGQLSAQSPETSDTDRYVYDPRTMADFETLESMEGSFTAPGAAFVEGPKLIYHSAPVEEPFELSGQMRLDAWIELDVPDTDLAAWIYEVQSTGKTVYLGKCLLRARFRNGIETATLATPGRTERYRFDRFPWISRQVQKGSRIRLVIAPLNDPDWQKNYHGDGPVAQQSVEDARTATVKLHLGPDRPSKLVLPVRSGGGS